LEYKDFDSLPNGIKKRLIELHPNDHDEWVHEAIPALNGRSIIDTINSENGMTELNQYLRKVESYLGKPDI
jgi:hypothetical protein